MNYENMAINTVEILILYQRKPRWVHLTNLERPRAWYPVVGVLGNRLMIAAGKVSTSTDIFELLKLTLRTIFFGSCNWCSRSCVS